MKILVTGGCGFIGSHLVDQLLVNPKNQVVVFDSKPPLEEVKDKIGHIRSNILNSKELLRGFRGIDYVYHLAAIADVNDVYQRPFDAGLVNTQGTLNVLEAARFNQVKRVILASTDWVYSNCPEEMVDEETRLCRPAHLYTVTKIAAEYYCHSYWKLYSLPFTILRYGIPYGPRARKGGVIFNFVKRGLEKKPLLIHGSGSQFRQFIYVEDLAEGNIAALSEKARNRIYNLDGAKKITIREIAETVQKIIPGSQIKHVKERPGDPFGKSVSIERVKKELSWLPTTSFEEGLRKYLNWYKNTKWEKEK